MARACSAPYRLGREQRRELQGPFHGLNANGLPNGKPDQFYQELAGGELKGYPSIGRDDREKVLLPGHVSCAWCGQWTISPARRMGWQHLNVIGSSQGAARPSPRRAWSRA